MRQEKQVTSQNAESPEVSLEQLPQLPHMQPLDAADAALFLQLLDNPPPPNAALRKLMKRD